MEKALPAIPAKRYFTIGEVSELCGVKPYVLRYWEQEFTQLKPMKRRGNRRYYQHHEVLLIRRIRELLYEHGFTISGARNRLAEMGPQGRLAGAALPDSMGSFEEMSTDAPESFGDEEESPPCASGQSVALASPPPAAVLTEGPMSLARVREELISIRTLLAQE
ncbi:MerR family transcriptional regulator [Caldimonas caldifontis]|uniref:MerR family transcriptional regulator n=1 Tax=Caldimonas caldifontis TaxID=1452508 RepID=A0A2S5STG9_9BURK|nr:MerR family transcriptional regulator [Caldimonas caldifontis]PPE66035.1 MerR family transcriptional regulator [Caldimonas caldifontis]